jgi:hypothetical protein
MTPFDFADRACTEGGDYHKRSMFFWFFRPQIIIPICSMIVSVCYLIIYLLSHRAPKVPEMFERFPESSERQDDPAYDERSTVTLPQRTLVVVIHDTVKVMEADRSEGGEEHDTTASIRDEEAQAEAPIGWRRLGLE